ncbi:manganese catalase family protein [Eubacterium sp. AF15-50]|uniref:manganese catalase family protein n=1 Tax=unclassified Eubacterium (in: firmicutes) TaxID=2624479 RepID=UPI000E484E54|nr:MULTISPECIES: manganese catalase family protein [unclassified Eubacterium (in: firmicutes)]RHR72239.1 manganese catalase family protein [Eubacterium sp. AF16-48]RHR79978.1 manganese catalase family protein [Eubacterium sp. AF15-50]
MYVYEKRLQYPVNIKCRNPKMAQVIISQYGGPDGEASAAMRYMSQKYAMKNSRVAGLLNDIATEEMSHLEIVGTIVSQLVKDLPCDEVDVAGFEKYYVDHTLGVWPQAASGVPFTATEFQSSGDPIADLVEDMAAEQKARKTYDNILSLVKDNKVADPIRFLRKREIVHFQRFGEALRLINEDLDKKNFYAFNPSSCVKNC